ncbi:hypothetical protein PSN45_003787 [Yamadazyma tenuis]|uniref:P-loop containing nucleoside triphosphate hydrolase protein n=1 Tax=Candida tenuis (strain ATCC 10573 / BCRC 21748 / CBS 615 / JCM 9827 / NBRC 10315 / NRRL Y-1498 / VKM Y-70) TaxID=590646 RepID=G3B395_CANTC|nr:uncharacterized protein CANTEDRAFT_104661 [Yamadazyma tenuis ATCC 10573]EGV64114.1 hypothetical protein CANTEDRAFT_104661 [Yamadazyma tenuis ATCC 10573]WEJ96251.1 hypothetical protein PSN45_003787 [Yamadazyma tenuis]
MNLHQDNFGTLNQEYDICLLGTESSGKTSLVLYYIHNRYIEEENAPEDLYTKVVRTGHSYNEVTILDLNPRQDNYSSSRKRQLMNNSGMVFAYSITDHHSFHDMEQLYEQVVELRGGDQMPPVVVVGLKSDLEDERNVSYEEGKQFSDQIGALKFLEANSRWGTNVDKVFEPLAEIIRQKKSFGRRLSQVAISPRKSPLASTPEGSPRKAKNHIGRIEEEVVKSEDFHSAEVVPVKHESPSKKDESVMEQVHEDTKNSSRCCVVM